MALSQLRALNSFSALDEGDDVTDEERRALHEALSTAWKSAEAGHVHPFTEILNELRRRRRAFWFDL